MWVNFGKYDRAVSHVKSELRTTFHASDVAAGWVTDPTDLDDVLAKTTPLTPRYAIYEQHGNHSSKVRLLDDFLASAVDVIAETDDSKVPGNLGVFVVISPYYKLLASGRKLICATSDLAHAYNRVPIQEGRKEFATILLAPPDGRLEVATLRTQPFGSRRSPANWVRVTMFVKWVTAAMFRVVSGVYVGDICIAKLTKRLGRPSKRSKLHVGRWDFNWNFRKDDVLPPMSQF